MKYLLDTHSFIWAVTSDYKKLSEKALKVVQDSENEIFVSVITFWEMSIKKSIGKIDLGKAVVEDFIEHANRNQFTIASLSPLSAATNYQLPWRKSHRDQFDRLLVRKAIKNDFCLISKDSDFNLYSDLGLKLIW